MIRRSATGGRIVIAERLHLTGSALYYLNLKRHPEGGRLKLVVRFLPRLPRTPRWLCRRRNHRPLHWLQGTATYVCRCGEERLSDHYLASTGLKVRDLNIERFSYTWRKEPA